MILDRLKAQGYITERVDKENKRSKRLQITKSGEKVLAECKAKLNKVSEMIFFDIPKDDILLCIQLLKDIDIKFLNLTQKHKNLTFEQAFKDVTGKV